MNAISDYLKPNMPLPQYLPYARFLLDADLSHTAKLLYTLLLDRTTLSQKNNWVDDRGRIYVIYPLSNLAKDLGCCISSVTRAFTESEKTDLAERVRYGFSKPSHILLKVPHTVQNCAVIVCTSAQADCAETHSTIAQKCTPNQRNKNNPNDNHRIRSNNACLSLGEYQNVFLTEKEYKRLKADFAGLDSFEPLIFSPPAESTPTMPPPCASGQNGKSQNRSKHRASRTTHSGKEKAYKDD